MTEQEFAEKRAKAKQKIISKPLLSLLFFINHLKFNTMRELSKKDKVRHFDALQIVEKFNQQYPVGSIVKLRKIGKKSYPQFEVKVKSEAFVSNSHDPVAFFEDLSGYYAIEPPFVEYN